jgi:hypothetical protein
MIPAIPRVITTAVESRRMRVRFEQGKVQWLAKVHTESVTLYNL